MRWVSTSKILWTFMNHWTATLRQKKPHGIAIWFSLTTSLQTWIGLRRRRLRRRRFKELMELAASTRSSSSTQTSVAQGRGANPVRFRWTGYGERTINQSIWKYSVWWFQKFSDKERRFLGKCVKITNDFWSPPIRNSTSAQGQPPWPESQSANYQLIQNVGMTCS